MSQTIEIRSDADKAVFQALKSFEGALIQAHMETLAKFASMTIQGAFILNGTVGIAAFATDTIGRVIPVRELHLAEVYNWLSYAIQSESTDQHSLNAPLPYASSLPTWKKSCSVTLHPYKNPCAVVSAVFVVISIALFCLGLITTIRIYQIEINA